MELRGRQFDHYPGLPFSCIPFHGAQRPVERSSLRVQLGHDGGPCPSDDQYRSDRGMCRPWSRVAAGAPDPGGGLFDHQIPGQDHEAGCRPGSADRLQSRFEGLRWGRGRPCVRSASTAAGRRRLDRGVPEHPLLPGPCARPVAASIERLSHIAAGIRVWVGDSGGGPGGGPRSAAYPWGWLDSGSSGSANEPGEPLTGPQWWRPTMAPMAPPLVWRVVTASSTQDPVPSRPGRCPRPAGALPAAVGTGREAFGTRGRRQMPAW